MVADTLGHSSVRNFLRSPCKSRLRAPALTPFGDVIEIAGSAFHLINDGMARRYHDLAAVDVGTGGGRPLISLFRGRPHAFPLTVKSLERHPLGSQAFFPLCPRRSR